MMRYYQDRWTGAIRSQAELRRLVERRALPRYQVGRRFRALPERCCRVLDEAERVAARAAGADT